jgi:uncharacterized protein
MMRIVAVEEHFNLPALVGRIPPEAATARGFWSRDEPYGALSMADKLGEVGASRITELDAAGVTVQILSLDGPGADLLPGDEGVSWARDANDALAAIVAAHPERLAGFAHLPLGSSEAAADELSRAVEELGFRGALIRGATDGRYLDHVSFTPLLARAASLGVPLYLHPAPSPAPVREALYSGLPGDLSFWMSISGWGCHADTAVHVLRLMLSGAFDRHPSLQLIVGHLGEGLQVVLPRLDQQFHHFGGFAGLPSALLSSHLHVSISGFLIRPSFMALMAAFGADRILFSVDYPFGSLEASRAFLDDLPLSPEDRVKVAHGNADRLLKLNGVVG